MGLGLGFFSLNAYLVFTSVFFSLAFSPADKIQADEQMFASYNETALGILGMLSKNRLSFAVVSAVKSQGTLLA